MILTIPSWGIGIGCAGFLIAISTLAMLNSPARSRLLGVMWLLFKGSGILLVAGSLAAFFLQNVSAYMPPINPQNAMAKSVAIGMSDLLIAYAWIAVVVAPVIAAAISVHRVILEMRVAA